MINITEAKTAELVTFYNEHAAKPVKKFADRKTAERRVAELVERLEARREQTMEELEAYAQRQEAHRQVSALIAKVEAKSESKEFAERAASENRSAGIAASWNDADVAAKRSQRSAVEVDGNTYRSVRQAFAQLNLPMKEHITFRMLLKEHGQLNEYGFSWKIVPLNY